MGILDTITAWANSGSTVEPVSAKVDSGWEVKERPPASWLNWLSNRLDNRSNALLSALSHVSCGFSPHLEPINLYGALNARGDAAEWHVPYHPCNTCEIDTEVLTNAVIGWDDTNEYPWLISAGQGSFDGSSSGSLFALPCWQYGEDDLVDLLETWTITPGFTVTNESDAPMCVVDGYLYILLQPTTGGRTLQQYAIANWSGVPIASHQMETAVGDTGTWAELVQIGDNHIGAIQLTSAGYITAYEMDKSLTLNASKTTTAGASYANLRHRITSDGDFIYFLSSNGANIRLNRFEISTNTFDELNIDTTTDYYPYDLVCIGDNQVVVMLVSTAAQGNETQLIVCYDVSGTLTAGHRMDLGTGKVAPEYEGFIGFDGQNIYPFFVTDDVERTAYARYDASKFLFVSGDTPQTDALPASDYPPIVSTASSSGIPAATQALAFYDGRDMWMFDFSTADVYRITSPRTRAV